jgi:hypothetical protein
MHFVSIRDVQPGKKKLTKYSSHSSPKFAISVEGRGYHSAEEKARQRMRQESQKALFFLQADKI